MKRCILFLFLYAMADIRKGQAKCNVKGVFTPHKYEIVKFDPDQYERVNYFPKRKHRKMNK